MKKKPLSASQEDYMEAIFNILGEKKAVKARDIADRLGVTRPSVTGALRTLQREGMINHAPYDVITLTDVGEQTAAEIVRRHDALNDFFVTILGVNRAEAGVAACAVEHAMPKAVLDKLITFVEKTKKQQGKRQ